MSIAVRRWSMGNGSGLNINLTNLKENFKLIMFRADFNATFSHLNRNALWPYLTLGKRAHDIHSVKTECQLKKLMLVSHLFSSCRAIWTRWQDKVQGFEYKEGLLTFLSAPLQLFQNCAHMPLILEGSIRRKKEWLGHTSFAYLLLIMQDNEEWSQPASPSLITMRAS